MSKRIQRPFNTPERDGLTWSESWEGEDKGLIKCWEVGREIRNKQPDIAARAENGELPLLAWKGGIEKKVKKGEKYGTLFYLAQWQGLRGDDLDIDPEQESTLTCSKTGMRVIYTSDRSKYINA